MNYKLESTQNASGNSACPCGEISAYFGKCPVCKRVDAAVEAEREACAKIAEAEANTEDLGEELSPDAYAVHFVTAMAVAEKIRARGGEDVQ